MRKIKNIVERVRRLAEQYPKAKYTPDYDNEIGCSYVSGTVTVDGMPGALMEGCLVGNALTATDKRRAGQLENSRGQMAVATLLSELTGKAYPAYWGVDVPKNETERLVHWLGTVQDLQDSGYTWATAVERADKQFGPVVAG